MQLSHHIVFKVLIVLFLFSGNPHQLQATDSTKKYYTLEKRTEFAQYLFNQGDFLRAVDEFTFILANVSQQSRRDSLRLYIGLSYFKGNRFSRSLKMLTPLLPNKTSQSSLSVSAYSLAAFNYYKQHKYRRLNTLSNPSLATTKDSTKMYLVYGINHLYTKEWEPAQDYFIKVQSRVLDNTKFYSIAENNFALAEKGANLSKKSPIVAGALSTAVPGLGRVYLDRSGEGVFSLLTIGILGYNAYSAFSTERKTSLYGWLNLLPAVSLYFGNIYGSITGAYIYNQQQVNDIHQQVEVPDAESFINY